MSEVTVKKDKQGKWRWSLKADNGRIIGASTQGYRRRSDCVRNICMVADELFYHIGIGSVSE